MSPGMAADAPGWSPEHPQRIADRAISRRLRHRLVIWVAKCATSGRSYRFLEVLAISPRLFRPFLSFNARLMLANSLGRRNTELVILRVAALCGSRYEWVQHTEIAARAGLTAVEIDAAGDLEGEVDLSPADRLLLTAADEFVYTHRLSDETWDSLRSRFNPRTILELCMLVGGYAMLAGALNAFGAPLEKRHSQ